MKQLNKGFIAIILAITLAITGISGYLAYNSFAARDIDESRTVSFAEFSARHNIPMTTIFIGTHLITLESATDELWEMALESQTASGQAEIYYKSELTNGTWFDITDAESIIDINGDGVSVNTEDLAELRIMYYTFDYGMTRLAINDMRHCIFDGDYNYWDLYHLDELQSIRDQYDMIVSRNNTDSDMDKHYRGLLGDFFNTDLRNDATNEADDALYALQDVYDELVAADRKDDSDIIYKLMAKLDNKRRSEIFRQLVEEDDKVGEYYNPVRDSENPEDFRNILDEILEKSNGKSYSDQSKFIINSEVVSAVGDDIGECQTTYLEKSSNLLEANGSRVIDELVYEVSKRIIDAASGGLTEAMDTDITRLGHLFNIDDQKVINKYEELAIVNNELLGPVTDKFASNALARPSTDYNAALNAGASDAALSGILSTQESELDFVRLELQDVIKAKVDRMPVEDAMAFTYDRINLSQDILNQVPTTDFASNANAQIKRHIKWLSDLLADLYEQSKSGNSELDNLQNKADSLLVQQQLQLDANNYRQAKELESAREVVLNEIDDMLNKLNDIINDPNANAGEKALAQAILDGGHDGMAKLIQGIVNDALEKQNNGEDISDEVDLLTALGATDALSQLGITDGTGGDGTGGDGTGGDVSGKGISSDALLGLLAGLLGDINSLSQDQLAGAIRALEMIYDMGYDGAGTLAARLANIAKTKGNKYIYNQLNDVASVEYVDISTLAKVADYRYAYDNSKKTGTLIGSGIKSIYQFAAGDNTLYEAVNRDTKNPIFNELYKMRTNVRYYLNLYAPVEVVNPYFNCVACHIKKSSYGVCITSKMEGEAKSLVAQLLPMIEGSN